MNQQRTSCPSIVIVNSISVYFLLSIKTFSSILKHRADFCWNNTFSIWGEIICLIEQLIDHMVHFQSLSAHFVPWDTLHLASRTPHSLGFLLWFPVSTWWHAQRWDGGSHTWDHCSFSTSTTSFKCYLYTGNSQIYLQLSCLLKLYSCLYKCLFHISIYDV